MAERLGSAVLELKTDSKGYVKGVKAAEKSAGRLEKRFASAKKGMAGYTKGLKQAGIGIAAVAAIATAAALALFKLTANFAAQGDKLAKTSKQIGVGVVQLQKWQFAVERSGADGEKFVKALIKMRVELERVALGETAESASAFERLGIEINDLTTGSILPLEELLPLLADKIAALTNEQEKASVAALIFGTRMGPQLVPFLNEGSKGIEALGDKLEELGFISEEAAALSEDFVDAQRNLTQSTTSLKSIIATELMPRMTDLINNLSLWISKNDELIGQKVDKFLQGLVDVLPAVVSLAQKTAAAISAIAQGVRDVKTAAEEVNAFLKQFAPEVKEGQPGLLDFLFLGLGKGILVVEETEEAINGLDSSINDFNETLEETPPILDDVFIPLSKVTKGLSDAEKAQEAFTQSIDDQIASIERELAIFFLTREQLIKYEADVLRATLASEGFNEAELAKINLLEKERLALLKLESIRAQVDEIAAALGGQLAEGFKEGADAAEDELDSLGVFAATVAANINTAFADTLTELIFDFENFGDSIKNVLRSILNAFFQMIATIATNPIRLGLEASLSGGSGAGAGVAGGAGGLGSSILGGLGGAGGLFGASGSFTALGSVLGFGSSTVGFAATLGAAIPAIGIILAAVAIAIPLIMSLLKKSPKIDIDIGVLKREIDGEMVKRGANVQEFLDALDAPNSDLAKEIVRFSTVQGGVGLKGKAREKVRLAILTVIGGSIEAIQLIIAKLPEEMFLALSESLLSAEIDIENFKGGDKLLEFDKKGKKVMQDLMDFISGTLPARFFASLSESFFVPMLETLGVTSEGAQELMDDFVESLKGASPEAAKILGEEFIATIDAYVDVFNLLNEGMKGVMGKALDDIRALATSLDIESATGIPTLREIEAALQDLFETGQLTAEVAQDFLLLRAAVISLTVGLAQSISRITSIISQLDADIVGLGGSAIGGSGGIREAIDSLQNLLDNEGLSLDEREAILNELNRLADQLGATELANMQQAIQGNIAAVNSQIQNLQLLKTVEADKNQAALNALNEQLNLVEALESFIEGIRNNISSLLLAPGGPESVSERLSRARGGIADLFAQLAGASPEDQLGIASQLQDLLNELNTLRQEGFQAPSAESDDLFREIVLNLEKLEGLLEPARSSEEIQASIETIEAASQVLLSSIDSQIASFQSQLTGLQSTGNQLTGAVAAEIRALKEAIRAEFVLILEERLLQLEEVTSTGFEVELDALNSIDKSGMESVQIENEMLITLRSMAAQITGGGLSQSTNPFAANFVPGFAQGGFVPPGVDMVAMLHGGSQGEDVIPRDGNSGNVYLTLPPMTFSASQVVNPKMFMSELMKSLHDRRVTDEIVKVTRGRK